MSIRVYAQDGFHIKIHTTRDYQGFDSVYAEVKSLDGEEVIETYTPLYLRNVKEKENANNH